MRISVNLATRPFVELRPFFLRLRVLMGVLAAVAVAAIVWAHVYQVRLDRAQAQMDQLQAKIDAAQQEKSTNERRMRQPANASILDRAHFLNGLFLRKSFSWTAVMMDLETVLPNGVQVTSIEPEISADGDVVIRLRVSGDRDRAVQLVRNLERSRRFLLPRLTGESVQAKEANTPGGPIAGPMAAAAGAPAGVEFEILADYNPLPEGEAYVPVKLVHANTAAAGGGSSRNPSTSRRPSTTRQPGTSRRPGDGIILPPFAARHPAPPPGGVR